MVFKSRKSTLTVVPTEYEEPAPSSSSTPVTRQATIIQNAATPVNQSATTPVCTSPSYPKLTAPTSAIIQTAEMIKTILLPTVDRLQEYLRIFSTITQVAHKNNDAHFRLLDQQGQLLSMQVGHQVWHVKETRETINNLNTQATTSQQKT